MTTFTYGPGFGTQAIGRLEYDFSGNEIASVPGYHPGDIIVFEAGVEPTDVRTRLVDVVLFDRSIEVTEQRRDLIIEVGDSTLRIYKFTLGMNVTIHFSDGTIENYGSAIAELDGGASDTLLGTAATDVFESRGTSDVLQGEGGADTYAFVGAFGNDTLSDPSQFYDWKLNKLVATPDAGPSTLLLEPSITADDVFFRASGDDLVC